MDNIKNIQEYSLSFVCKYFEFKGIILYTNWFKHDFRRELKTNYQALSENNIERLVNSVYDVTLRYFEKRCGIMDKRLSSISKEEEKEIYTLINTIKF